jgi:hypothetical protein
MSGSSTLEGAGRSYSSDAADSSVKELDGLTVGSHAAYVFSDSGEKQQKLFSLISESLRDPSAAVLYIAGKQGVKGIRFSMKDYGIDVGAIEREGKMKIVDYDEWYLIAGRTPTFKPIATLREQISDFAKKAEKSGCYYVTIISETDALVRKGFCNKYRELELDLGKNVSDFRAILVCAYDERELAAAKIVDAKTELSNTHSMILG